MRLLLGLIVGALGVWLWMHGIPQGLRSDARDKVDAATGALEQVAARDGDGELRGGFSLVRPPGGKDAPVCIAWGRDLACPAVDLRHDPGAPVPFAQRELGDGWRAAMLVLRDDRQVVCVAHRSDADAGIGCALVGGEHWTNAWPRVGAARAVERWEGLVQRRVTLSGGQDLLCLQSLSRGSEGLWCDAVSNATAAAAEKGTPSAQRYDAVDGWAGGVVARPGAGTVACALHVTGGTEHAQGALGCTPFQGTAPPAARIRVTTRTAAAPADGWSRLCVRIGGMTAPALRFTDGGDAAGVALFPTRAGGRLGISCPEAAGSTPRSRTR